MTMQKLESDSRASSVRGPKYGDVEREMEREQRRLVEERLELEEQRRKFMMGKGQEEERMKPSGPVSMILLLMRSSINLSRPSPPHQE